MTIILAAAAVTIMPLAAFIQVIRHYGRQPALPVPVEFEPDWRQPADRNVVVLAYEEATR